MVLIVNGSHIIISILAKKQMTPRSTIYPEMGIEAKITAAEDAIREVEEKVRAVC